MKAMVSTMRWMNDNRDQACAYLTKEMVLSMEHCRHGSDYNWKSRIWDRNADLNVEGVRTVMKITADQGILKEPLPPASKYIDQSYLKQALAEIEKIKSRNLRKENTAMTTRYSFTSFGLAILIGLSLTHLALPKTRFAWD
jgi:hypothetical protein